MASTPRHLNTVPSFHEKLIGREADLQRLHRALQTGESVVLMNGMGGVGKTTPP